MTRFNRTTKRARQRWPTPSRVLRSRDYYTRLDMTINLEHPSYRPESASMTSARPMPLKRRQMQRRAIALVGGEAIVGIPRIQHAHLAIARDLGQDRGRADGGHACVPADHGARRTRQRRTAVAIDQTVPGDDSQRTHRAPHGEHGGAKDIVHLDLFDVRARYCPGQRALLDQHSKLVANV